VYWVDFEPARGGENKKQRPGVMVSNQAAINAQNRVQVLPLTSNVSRVYPWEALVNLNGVVHKALADQIRLQRRSGSAIDSATCQRRTCSPSNAQSAFSLAHVNSKPDRTEAGLLVRAIRAFPAHTKAGLCAILAP
jgi:mRNA-degrading endonuclease toxin of MazEF toxin-antitoxin module